MTTVTAGNTASFEMGPFDTITLTSSKGFGTLALTSQAPKLVGDQTLSIQNGTFGPWGAPMSVVMTVRQGSVDYTVNVKSLTETDAAAAQALVSGAGPGNTGNARIDALIDAGDLRSYTFAEALSLAPSNAGKWFWIPAVGDGGSWWFADPSGYLRPAGGKCHIVSRVGSVGSPLVSANGATSYVLTLPVQPVIPAGMLIPGQSKIEFEAWIKRSGTNGSAALRLYLGLNNSTSTDFQLVSETAGATDNLDSTPAPLVTVATTTRLTTAAFKQRYGTTGAATSYDSSVGAFNTAVANYGNIQITSANALDTFRLIAYRLSVEQ